jgi:hypothetical protein
VDKIYIVEYADGTCHWVDEEQYHELRRELTQLSDLELKERWVTLQPLAGGSSTCRASWIVAFRFTTAESRAETRRLGDDLDDEGKEVWQR